MKKYSAFLTTFLIILVIIMVILLGYYVYILYDNYNSNKIADNLIENFSNEVVTTENIVDNNEENIEIEEETPQTVTNQSTNNPPSSSGLGYSIGTNYNGYMVIGIISIPSLNVKYPIFNVDNSTTLKLGTAAIYPLNVEEALNKHGNVVIAGHNYRNNSMFSKLYTLPNDSLIYITNKYGETLEYKVYNNYTADVLDFSYATREVEEEYAEISLSTCTRDANTRTIIWARAHL